MRKPFCVKNLEIHTSFMIIFKRHVVFATKKGTNNRSLNDIISYDYDAL